MVRRPSRLPIYCTSPDPRSLTHGLGAGQGRAERAAIVNPKNNGLPSRDREEWRMSVCRRRPRSLGRGQRRDCYLESLCSKVFEFGMIFFYCMVWLSDLDDCFITEQFISLQENFSCLDFCGKYQSTVQKF